jgi:hypothetical protein
MKKVKRNKKNTKQCFSDALYKWANENDCGPGELITYLEIAKADIIENIRFPED